MLAASQAGLLPRLPVAALSNLLALSPALLRTLNTLAVDDEPHTQQDKRYVDRLKVTARAGRGGNGCVSFYQGASRGAYRDHPGSRRGMRGSIGFPGAQVAGGMRHVASTGLQSARAAASPFMRPAPAAPACRPPCHSGWRQRW